ncbi:flavin reductase family protein [Nitratireductor indicus]|uniref:flavin reductase family protein n=1 Tax=Nitratireductor indicus TaxID=721133 RepID=UPI002874A1DC|nr:flavin reductase family protein [Nitratireductor indicus]MDS1136181.1 flavin reductase family protein [Nitratireductor indicus]
MAEPDMRPAIDIGTFWKAIGVRAVGAAVVAARNEAGPAGLLALSATHLCASPPILMVSIGRKTSALSTILDSRHFSINYLAEDDAELAETFGGKGPLKGSERFSQDRWTTLSTGAPILKGAIGALDCELEETIERHDTIIALGRLIDFSTEGLIGKPLISFAGRMGV